MKTEYAKPFCSTEKLLEILETRGLAIDCPRQAAIAFLETVNYYRFTGYAIHFQSNRTTFKPGAAFSRIRDLYLWDRELRDILFSAVEAVELTFRAILAHVSSGEIGPLGYLDAANFSDSAKHAEILSRLLEEFDRSTLPCARHFRQNYLKPPIWALVETASFGTLVRLLRAMLHTLQNNISKPYGLRGDLLSSYLQHLSVVRNLCAHHGRLFDHRDYGFRPPREWNASQKDDTRALFHLCRLVFRLLRPTAAECYDRDSWKSRLCAHFSDIPDAQVCDLRAIAAIPPGPAAEEWWDAVPRNSSRA